MSHKIAVGGMLMKITRSALLVVMTVMVAFASAQAGFYAGFQVGPNFPMTSGTHDLAFAPGFMMGAQAGYDFLERNVTPNWTQYFTLAVDYQYNSGSGSQNALSFLGIVKVPMMASRKFWNGRLFPYIGVGPSIVWTQIENHNSTNVGIVVEPGVRFMFTPKISGDLAYRFRYVAPSFTDNNVKVSFNSLNSAIVFRVNYHF
jgi:opacity protein-like surface antigen